MKSSPVYTKYETPDYIGYEFDPQLDFALFLKEARTQACNQSLEEAPPNSDEPGKKQEDEVQKNEKKSWRRSLFSWLKAEKRKKPNSMERSKSNNNNNSSHNKSKPIRSGYVSGPVIDQSGGGSASASGSGRSRRAMSGSLNGLFNSTKKMMEDNNIDDDHTKRIPYTSLESINNPPTLQSYGPIYMVT